MNLFTSPMAIDTTPWKEIVFYIIQKVAQQYPNPIKTNEASITHNNRFFK